jgi:starch synthase
LHVRPLAPKSLHTVKILIVSSEVVPFAKTGGLADVTGALPIELARMGHDVRIAMPKYASIDDDSFNLLPILDTLDVWLGPQRYGAQVRRTMLPETEVPVYFVQHEAFFGRAGLYGTGSEDYADNSSRFAFFCKAVIWLLKGLDWIPEVIHCNDWQTALIPVYLRTQPEMSGDKALASARVLYTIHNLAYQGQFPLEHGPLIDIGPDLLHPAALEFYGNLNLMKGGILYADAISTVSPRYAKEIQTKEFGAGLEGVLQQRRRVITGILNGIDYSVWNPATDPHIAANYSPKDMTGKSRCKAALQKECKLPADETTPLIGIISRLDPQKGFDLIEEAAADLLREGAQLVLLGTGAPEYHRLFESLAHKNPRRVSAHLKFDNALAHRIEAGSDMFLMPSRYEPCGLNQLYSLKYGTIPVVRRTGGLADSVEDATRDALARGRGTGFVFDDYTPASMLSAVRRAVRVFRDKSAWQRLMHNAMAEDFSWAHAAREYEKLYSNITETG